MSLFKDPTTEPPEPPVINADDLGADAFNDTIDRLLCMVSRIMTSTVDIGTAGELERHIKLFLQAFAVLDKKMQTAGNSSDSTLPKWITASNFLSLLNLPDNMKSLGVLRNLWEGDGKGEGIMRKLKPLFAGHRGRVYWNMLTRFYQTRGLDQALDALDATDDGDSDSSRGGVRFRGDHYREVFQYKDVDDATAHFNTGKPVSAVSLSGDAGASKSLFMITKNERRIRITLANDAAGERHVGAWYFPWKLGRESALQPGWEKTVEHYCLLLPRLTLAGLPTAVVRFSTITSQWWELLGDKSFGQPQANGVTYSIDEDEQKVTHRHGLRTRTRN